MFSKTNELNIVRNGIVNFTMDQDLSLLKSAIEDLNKKQDLSLLKSAMKSLDSIYDYPDISRLQSAMKLLNSIDEGIPFYKWGFPEIRVRAPIHSRVKAPYS